MPDGTRFSKQPDEDFYNIWLISQSLGFQGSVLGQAIRFTFERRQTLLPSSIPTALCKEFSDDPDHTRQWVAFVRRIGERISSDHKQTSGVSVADFASGSDRY